MALLLIATSAPAQLPGSAAPVKRSLSPIPGLGLKKLYGDVGLKIVRYEEPIGPADFTWQQLRLVKRVARKP